MLGWQASGMTSWREAWVLEGLGCGGVEVWGGGYSVGIFMAGGALAVQRRFCLGIWIVI